MMRKTATTPPEMTAAAAAALVLLWASSSLTSASMALDDDNGREKKKTRLLPFCSWRYLLQKYLVSVGGAHSDSTKEKRQLLIRILRHFVAEGRESDKHPIWEPFSLLSIE